MSGIIDRRAVLRGSGIGACALALVACAEREQPDAAEPKSGEVLLQLSELEVGSAKVVTTQDDAPVAVVRSGKEEVHAFSGVCTHQGCTIEAEKKQFECPCHGSQFAFQDGSVQHGPAEQPLPEVEVGIENGAVVTR